MRIGIDARKIADFGIGTYIRGLLRGLVDLGTSDEYVAFAPDGAELPHGVEHVVVDAPHYSLRELITVGRAAARAGVDLLHAPHYVTPITRLPLVVTIHDLIHLHQPLRNPLAPFYARLMIRRAVRGASRILTITEAVKQDLESELGASQVIMASIGVDTPAPNEQTPGNPRDERPFLLFVGNDKPHKNVDLLVEAFARARRDRTDLTLVLAGAPFARFRAVPGVSACGYVSNEELERLYREAIALVMPSREEGFGLPAAEAMARGTAVITSTAAALVEVTGDAAIHVPANDSAALARAILRVANDTGLRRDMARRGVERAGRFTWQRCAEMTHAAYIDAFRTASRRR